MILRRLGNKKKIAELIIPYFPEHDCYREPCFGAGGMAFTKPLAKYNYFNDIDNEVMNLYMQVQFNHKALYEAIENIPYHRGVFNWLKSITPDNDLYRAVKFVIMSNYTFLGKEGTLVFGLKNHKQILLQNIEKTYNFLCKGFIQFSNVCFREFYANFPLKDKLEMDRTFTYIDPPYLETVNNYNCAKWTEQDVIDTLDVAMNDNTKFAYSEAEHPFVVDQAKKRGLNIIKIKDIIYNNKKRTEILIINYDVQKKLRFL